MTRRATPENDQTAIAPAPCRRHALRRCAGLLAWLCALWYGFAAMPAAARPLAQFHHRVYGSADGAPEDISALGQTSDGMLWLATGDGIYKFDGVRFSRVPIERDDVWGKPYFLRGDSAGGLWIGWLRGGVSYLRGGTVTHFKEMASNTVWGFDFDRQGRVWAAGTAGVMRYDGRRWRQLGKAHGYTAQEAAAVVVDADDRAGIFTSAGLFQGGGDGPQLAPPVGHGSTRQPPLRGPGGQWYFLQEAGIRRIAALARYDERAAPWLYRGPAGSFATDHDGSLWFDGVDSVQHLAHPETDRPLRGALRDDTETFRQADGLSGKMVYAMFTDRDGDVWISTDGGLDRFHPSALVPVRPRGALLDNASMLPAEAGGVWVATHVPSSIVLRLGRDGAVAERLAGDYQLVNGGVVDGALFLKDGKLLVRRKAGRETPLPPLPADANLLAAACPRDGGCWISLERGGVWQEDARGGWRRESRLDGDDALTLHVDASDAVWFGFAKNRVVRLHGDTRRAYGAAEGVGVGNVAAMADAADGLWLAGSLGVGVLRGDRFVAVQDAGGMLNNLSDMVFDRQGGLWLTGMAGLMHLDAARLRQAGTQPLMARLYAGAEGLRGRSQLLWRRALAVDEAGCVWVATPLAVYWIDPARPPAPDLPPQVGIDSATVAGRRVALPAAVTLPAGTRDVQIGYTAAVLDTPEQARFRYRLDGYDQAWRDGNSLRQADYTGLPPGRYRFRVAVALRQGDWSVTEAVLPLEVLPEYYQSTWFRALCALLAAATIFTLYKLRIASLARHHRAEADARLAERERIAAELHDTVLQSMQGVILQAKAAAMTLHNSPQSSTLLDAAIRHANDALAEGRDRVQNLRLGHADQLAELWRLNVAESAAPMPVEIGLEGVTRALDMAVKDELYVIGREALRNAIRHSGATRIVMTLGYGDDELTLCIEDDGGGIAPAILAAGGRPGHWGLATMRRRAELIGGQLVIRSEPGRTVLQVAVPAQRAYDGGSRPTNFWRSTT